MSKRSVKILNEVEYETEVPASAYGSFLQSAVWDDLQAVIMGQIAQAQVRLYSAEKPVDIYRAQGAVAALQTVLALPETIFETLTQLQEEGKQDAETE